MAQNSIFTKLGLPIQSALIYQSLVKNGPTTIAGIAKTTGLYRPVVYRYLPSLLEKSLVSQTKLGKRTMFAAESPAALNNMIQDLQNELTQTLPSLVQQYEKSAHQPVIRYFQGRQGIAYVFDLMLRSAKKDEIIYRYESPADYAKNKKYYPPLYRELAMGQSKIQKFVITNEKTQTQRRPKLERYSKAVPVKDGGFEYDITQIIYGDKVAFIDYKTETASLIENRVFADFQRQVFKLLFNRL